MNGQLNGAMYTAWTWNWFSNNELWPEVDSGEAPCSAPGTSPVLGNCCSDFSFGALCMACDTQDVVSHCNFCNQVREYFKFLYLALSIIKVSWSGSALDFTAEGLTDSVAKCAPQALAVLHYVRKYMQICKEWVLKTWECFSHEGW